MFPGTPLQIGAETYTVPALSLGQLRAGAKDKIKAHDDLVAEADSFGATVLRGEIILIALRRNYPDFTEELLFDNLDLNNVGPLWLAVLGASGFVPGEIQAATEATKTGT